MQNSSASSNAQTWEQWVSEREAKGAKAPPLKLTDTGKAMLPSFVQQLDLVECRHCHKHIQIKGSSADGKDTIRLPCVACSGRPLLQP